MHKTDIAQIDSPMFDAQAMVLNMGPQHPSTHGVLRVLLKLDGETVIDLDCDIGYLHRGVEKICEHDTYPMITPYFDRLDYVAAVNGDLVYVEAVERHVVVRKRRRSGLADMDGKFVANFLAEFLLAEVGDHRSTDDDRDRERQGRQRQRNGHVLVGVDWHHLHDGKR